MAVMTLALNAREKQYNYNVTPDQLQSALHKQHALDVAHRLDKSRKLPLKDYLTGENAHYWTDGRFIVGTIEDLDTHLIEFFYEDDSQSTAAMVKPHFIKLKGSNATTVEKPMLKVTVEQLGAYTMLVYRNAAGTPVRAYYSITLDQRANGLWSLPVYHVLAGNYATTDGHNAVLGERLDFYTGDKYDRDPGLFVYYLHPDRSAIDIEYGDGRVSHGDPSSPKYDKMPGGGGAGAIMGPMEWQLRLSRQGLEATVTRDEPFVDHSPRLKRDAVNVLTKLQCPWPGIHGKWAFASVMPLTHELLMLFPADVLELMRAEIYARHGDSFKSNANQQYFNQQPWYKKSGKAVALTDVERFNIALIKQVMAGKK